MFSMTVLARQNGSVTLAVSGSVSEGELPEIDRFIDSTNQDSKRIMLDLSEVTLLDRAAARFFSEKLRRGIALVNCPLYIKPWISPETT